MNHTWENITLSIAGVCQATNLVESLAKTGYLKTAQFEIAVKSLFELNPESTEAVFDNKTNLEEGLEVLTRLLRQHRSPKNADNLRYVLGVLHLQRRLSRRSEMLYIIGNRLESAKKQAEHFGVSHDNVVANIAEIYSDTISKLPYRIQVTGEFEYLQQTRVANQVRVLLLAAIRAATLWRQNGGTRWHLIFQRSKLANEADTLINEIKKQIIH